MPEIRRRRDWPKWDTKDDFRGWGLRIEWPPLVPTPEPELLETIIYNEILVPGPVEPPAEEADAATRPPSLLLSTMSIESIGPELRLTTSSTASRAWPVANKAFYYPFYLVEDITVLKLWCVNGTTVSGNIDIGIYDASGTRKVSSGSTAHAGTNAMQVFDVTDTDLTAGYYYFACALDNTTGHQWSYNCDAGELTMFPVFQQTSAFALPSSATFADVSGVLHTPTIGLARRALVA